MATDRGIEGRPLSLKNPLATPIPPPEDSTLRIDGEKEMVPTLRTSLPNGKMVDNGGDNASTTEATIQPRHGKQFGVANPELHSQNLAKERRE